MIFEEAPLTGGFTGKGLPTQKFAEGETSRIYIFPEFSTRKIRTHFLKGMGVFLCLSNREKQAPCCEHLLDSSSSAKDKYLMVYMKYATRKDGTPHSDPVDPAEVYFWLCPPTKRNAISAELSKGASPEGDLSTQDLMIKCTEFGTQKIEISTTGPGTSLKDNPNFEEDYKKAYARAKEIFDGMAESAVIVYSEAQMKTKLATLGVMPGEVAQAGGLQAQTFQPQTFQPQVAVAPQVAPATQVYAQQQTPAQVQSAPQTYAQQQTPVTQPVTTTTTETPEDLEDFLNS